MKYIRTKDGIIKTELTYWYVNDMHKYLIVPNQKPVRKDKVNDYFKKHKIINQANTIEELCDEVCCDNKVQPLVNIYTNETKAQMIRNEQGEIDWRLL